MHGLFAIVMALSASSSTVTYKCRDATGNWTAQACLVVATLPESSYIRAQREREVIARTRRQVRNRLAQYCFQLDSKASVYDCVDIQMAGYDVINQLAKQFGAVSANSARLAACLAANLDARSQATDYRRTMDCYFAPGG